MLRTLLLLACAVVAIWTQTPSTESFLYDTDHDAVVYITETMCYEYHMKHNDTAGPELEAMVVELVMTANLHEMNEHYLDHFDEDLEAACANRTIYRL